MKAAKTIPTRDLTKKGLRPLLVIDPQGEFYSNERPDKEGIKTHPADERQAPDEIPTRDLTKKGLRRELAAAVLELAQFQRET